MVVGYDPGGNGAHGYAEVELENGNVVSATTETLESAEVVLSRIESHGNISGLGIDTLTCWGTGPGGWRPADRWLRQRYREVKNSVVSPNGLYGSMGLNGMAVLVRLREKWPSLRVTETHPKILYWALAGKRYDFGENRSVMLEALGAWLGVSVNAQTEHEWDAAISALAAIRELCGEWKTDLHELPVNANERLISPCGPTTFAWPR